MRKTILLYKSATGFTQKYAELLSAALNCETVRMQDASAKQLAAYETILFGTRVHAGRIDGLSKARKLFAASGAKEMLLFVTGGTPADATQVIDKLWQANLTPQEQKTMPHFYMPGGLCYEKMSLPDRLLMKLAAKMMSHAEPQDAVQAGFAQALGASYDISDAKYIRPLVAHLQRNGDSPAL